MKSENRGSLKRCLFLQMIFQEASVMNVLQQCNRHLVQMIIYAKAKELKRRFYTVPLKTKNARVQSVII